MSRVYWRVTARTGECSLRLSLMHMVVKGRLASFTRAVVEQRRALIRQRRDEKAEAESGDEEAESRHHGQRNLLGAV
ncbi:hypothetical protein CRUP_012483 [Coryphaenoides rupestris]|nr:hypothetical protein CRUP_012483 [Coryphaenoides rupestris]